MTSIEQAQAAFHIGIDRVPGLIQVGDNTPDKIHQLIHSDDVRPITRVRSDYEGTLTDGEYGEKPTSSWSVAREFMKDPEAHVALYRKYGTLEDSNGFTPELSREWNARANELLPGINYERYLDTLMERVVFKSGFNVFVKRLVRAEIPLEIVSTGFEQPINRGLTDRGIAVAGITIFANRLHVAKLDEKEAEEKNYHYEVTGADPERIVHSLNKNEFFETHSENEAADNGMHLVMGDKLHDARMTIKQGADSLVIRADGSLTRLLRTQGFDKLIEHLHASREAGFDAVATERTLHGPNHVLRTNLIRRGLESARRAA